MNLSQQKREKLLNFIKELKQNNSFDEQSLIALNEIENELNGKKYGLVWEEHEENVDVEMRNNIPVFTEVRDKEIQLVDGGGYNFLLEGDNLHSLYLLEKTHKGKIDFIYIDPPYNRGGKNDFIYDDSFVSSEDTFKHSKWLSFMSKRLSIAKTLLTKNGVMAISIDDNEYTSLKMACCEIFGEDNVETYIWCLQDSSEGSFVKTSSLTVRKEHEYLVVCFMKKFKFNKYKCQREYGDGAFTNPDNDPRGAWFSGNMSRNGIKSTTGSKYYEIVTPTGKKYKRNWTLSKEEYEEKLANNEIFFSKGGDGVPRLKIFKDAPTYNIQSSLFTDVHTSITGKNELKLIFNGELPFDFPKPTTLIRRLIEIVTMKKDAIIMDFFAGSGTTGQAVLEMNANDNGNRKFILCTNNENGICEEITYKRIKAVLTGKRDDGSEYSGGIPANLKFLKADFVSKTSKNLSKELTKHVKELIELEWGVSIDKKVNLMVMTEEELDKIEANWDKLKTTVKSIYRARQVVYTGKQKELFKNINNYIIPDYYFDNELKEVGENW